MGIKIEDLKGFQGQEVLVGARTRGLQIMKQSGMDPARIYWSETVLVGLSGTIVYLAERIESLEESVIEGWSREASLRKRIIKLEKRGGLKKLKQMILRYFTKYT